MFTFDQNPKNFIKNDMKVPLVNFSVLNDVISTRIAIACSPWDLILAISGIFYEAVPRARAGPGAANFRAGPGTANFRAGPGTANFRAGLARHGARYGARVFPSLPALYSPTPHARPQH